MKRLKILLCGVLTFLICACLYCPVFHAMPRFMDRYDADAQARDELKGKCSVCHIREDGYGALNAFGKDFAENDYRITDALRSRAPQLFTGGGAKPAEATFDVKAFYDKHCAVCHGADGKGGESAMIMPNFRDASWQKRRSDQSFFDAIAKGKGAMPAWKEKMSDEQIKSMTAFVRKFAEQ
jgi:mono/diheme cytochrome c family protein